MESQSSVEWDGIQTWKEINLCPHESERKEVDRKKKEGGHPDFRVGKRGLNLHLKQIQDPHQKKLGWARFIGPQEYLFRSNLGCLDIRLLCFKPPTQRGKTSHFRYEKNNIVWENVFNSGGSEIVNQTTWNILVKPIWCWGKSIRLKCSKEI